MTGRCEAESESFGQCTRPAGHWPKTMHWCDPEDQEVVRLRAENERLRKHLERYRHPSDIDRIARGTLIDRLESPAPSDEMRLCGDCHERVERCSCPDEHGAGDA